MFPLNGLFTYLIYATPTKEVQILLYKCIHHHGSQVAMNNIHEYVRVLHMYKHYNNNIDAVHSTIPAAKPSWIGARN